MGKKHLPKWNTILLVLYLSFVMICQLLVDNHFEICFFTIGTALTIICSALIAPFVLRITSSLNFTSEREVSKKWTRTLYYLIPMLVFLLYYLAYYPGGFYPDSINQYEQAITNQYNDWHPVLQTLIAFKLPLMLSGGWVGSIVLFQMLLFSIALGYSFSVMETYAGKRYTYVAMVFILINPQTGNIASIPFKDVSFAIGALLLLSFAVQIYYSDGDWLKEHRNIFFFATLLAFTTVFRHNALLFTVPLLTAVLFQAKPKQSLTLVLIVACIILMIKGPLYTILHVEQPGNRRTEVLGMPMTVIGAAVTFAPEKTDEDILEFAYKITPKEIWERSFQYGNFNAIKWTGELNTRIIETNGIIKTLNMTWRCLKSSTHECIFSLLKLTDGIFTLTDPHPIGITPYIAENPYGITMISLCPFINQILQANNRFVDLFVPHVFFYYGVAQLLLIISVLAKCRLNRLLDRKRILFVLPVFIYNFGTALLLTGNNDVPRFFYYTVLVLPVTLLFFYRGEPLIV